MSRFFSLYGEKILISIAQHFLYVVSAVAMAFVIAIVLGVLLSRKPSWANVLLPILSIFQTIPGIVFIGVLFIYNGMATSTVVIALTIYAIFPILKNTYVGLVDVDPALIEAAKGCGMTNFQTIQKVELPLAMPVIFSGLKMSTVYTVSWATLAAMIGMGSLGELIYSGIYSNNNTLILAGAIPAAIMAIFLSWIVDKIKDAVLPRSLKE
ncbi:MAG: ABC transporter permease [Clostridiaceae bacterium]|nr:ABC transporter permease [Clostridiaceae bacterium]